MKKHEWRERTGGGELRLVRATAHGGEWQVLERVPSRDSDWRLLDPPALADLEALREVLWRKYQRRRVSFEELVRVDALVEAAGGEKRFAG